MESQAFNIFTTIEPLTLILSFLGIFYLIKAIIEATKYIFKTFGLERKSDIDKEKLREHVDKLYTSIENVDNKIDSKIDKLREDIDVKMGEMQDQINEVSQCNRNIAEASREELADKINSKYKLYFKQGYIPLDEYDEFVNLHRAYKLVGGNHSGDEKFKKCCELLEIRDDSPETSILNSEINKED